MESILPLLTATCKQSSPRSKLPRWSAAVGVGAYPGQSPLQALPTLPGRPARPPPPPRPQPGHLPLPSRVRGPRHLPPLQWALWKEEPIPRTELLRLRVVLALGDLASALLCCAAITCTLPDSLVLMMRTLAPRQESVLA